MNKTDLINEVAVKTGMTKKDTEKVVNAFFDTVQGTLKTGEKVQLIGFGTFEVRQRQGRKGRNPRPDRRSVYLPPRFQLLRRAKP